MFGIIYKITSKIDGKRYVGQTIYSLEKRWRQHHSGNSECVYMSNAIKKYSKENFEIKILAKCNSIEEMNRREAYYIKLLNTLAPNGYNLRAGGLNSLFSEVSKKKMSESAKGENNPFFGKKHSEETKRKISLGKIGKPSHMLGKKHSEETKRKIGLIHLGKIESSETKAKKSASKIGSNNSFFGKKHSEETKRKISESMKSRCA